MSRNKLKVTPAKSILHNINFVIHEVRVSTAVDVDAAKHTFQFDKLCNVVTYGIILTLSRRIYFETA